MQEETREIARSARPARQDSTCGIERAGRLPDPQLSPLRRRRLRAPSSRRSPARLVRRGVSRCASWPRATGGRAARRSSTASRPPGALRVRRARETLAYRGTMQAALRAPSGLRALAGLWRALRRAAREEARGRRRPRSTPTGGCRRAWRFPPGARTRAHRRTAPTRRCSDAHASRARLARPVYPTREGRDGGLPRAGGLGPERRRPLRGRPTHVQPMPVDSSDRPWTIGGGGAVVVAGSPRRSASPWRIETVAFLTSCGHDLPLTIVGDGPERAALERQVDKLGIGPSSASPGPCRPPRWPSYLAAGGRHDLSGPGRGLRPRCPPRR